MALAVLQTNKDRYLNITTRRYVPGYSRYFSGNTGKYYNYRIPACMFDDFTERSRKLESKYPIQFQNRVMTIDAASKIYLNWYPKTMTFEEWILRQDITLYEKVVR